MQTIEAIILVGSIDTKRLNWFIFSQKTLSSPPMHKPKWDDRSVKTLRELVKDKNMMSQFNSQFFEKIFV